MVDHLERGGRVGELVRSARSAAAFRGLSGLSWPEMIRQGLALRRGTGRRGTGRRGTGRQGTGRRDSELTWGQVLMAANTPVLLRAAMVDGRTDLGLMSSGQVTGLIDDLPSCAELIGAIMREAEACLDRMATLRSASKDFQA